MLAISNVRNTLIALEQPQQNNAMQHGSFSIYRVLVSVSRTKGLGRRKGITSCHRNE
jgi:hypothetical protein